MGREIEKILLERGHSVALVIDTDNAADLNAANLESAISMIAGTCRSMGVTVTE